MRQIKRRDFVKKAAKISGAGAATFALACNQTEKETMSGPAVQTRKKYEWKMVTTWLPHFPVLGQGADRLAEWIEKMSEGRLKIQVYGGGELVPPFEAFDAVRQGVAQMGHGASYYWAGKIPAGQFFSSVPFGMNAQQMNAWIIAGGGQQLWEELYADFNLQPFPCGNTGVQMGGWFNKEINSLSDIKGLKMRIPGLGGKVIAKAGGSAILSALGEIYTNLERGVIDATEWIGPYHDYLMGFHRIAKYYYYPGWHEPGTVLELIVNKNSMLELPADLQEIIRQASYRSNNWMLAEFDAQNAIYLQKIRQEKKVDIRSFPEDVLKTFRTFAHEVIAELISSDTKSKKIYDSYSSFRKNIINWASLSEDAYYSVLREG